MDEDDFPEEFIKENLPKGFDERKMVENNKVHPYWSIGKIEVQFENPTTKSIGSIHGTAFVISKEHIMTAAHNL